MDSQISETKVSLDKEKAKYDSACRQQEVSVVARVTEWLLQEVILPVVEVVEEILAVGLTLYSRLKAISLSLKCNSRSLDILRRGINLHINTKGCQNTRIKI